jgi:hypothetical protein
MRSSQIAISKIVACSIYARVMDEFILTSVLIKLSTTILHDTTLATSWASSMGRLGPNASWSPPAVAPQLLSYGRYNMT